MSLSYNPNEKVGKLIEQPEITSPYIREILWLIEGINYLIKTNASSKEIENHLFKTLQYHAAKVEEIKVLLLLERGASNLVDINRTVNRNSKHHQQSRQVVSETKDLKVVEKSSIAKITSKNAIVEKLEL